MKNANKKFGTLSRMLCVIALVAVIGFSMTACGGDDGSGGGSDSVLNGTWISKTNIISGNEHIGHELQINNGNFEAKYFNSLDAKGTVNNGIVTTTHIHGSSSNFSSYNLESRWYSKDEAQTILNPAVFEAFFKQFAYSVNGNTLTWGENLYIRK